MYFFKMKLQFKLSLLIFLWISSVVLADESNNNISLYTGTFDLIDEEGDEKTTLFGIEHKNPNLFRDTFLGKFKPITGGFMTGKSSVYLYTGVEGQYGLGPLKILPSFAPGYYEAGDGKDLGSILEFKSEIKFGLDIFKNANLSYSYSHISNNNWGERNPGTDNQQITFSKNF
jgi:lipid A 3-O-deacylase